MQPSSGTSSYTTKHKKTGC